ncbi:MAG: hypothetical protein EP338_03100 [Bacteroidetes bacterium]|nr:MAG: hypothetical protein EP338_03100 [Bacteroidota bacterium]
MKHTITILLIITARGLFAQSVVGINMSNCDSNSDPEYMYANRLISKRIVNDTLHLELGLVRNCAFEPSVELHRRADSLIIEIENVSEIWMGCICCFEMIVKAVGIRDTSFTLIQKYQFEDFTKDGFTEYEVYTEIKSYPNKFIFPSITEIESATPDNQMTEDSLRIGSWYIMDAVTNVIKAKAFYFLDHEGKSRTKWRAVYDKEGNIIEVCAFTGVDSEGYSNVTCATKEQYLKLEIKKP